MKLVIANISVVTLQRPNIKFKIYNVSLISVTKMTPRPSLIPDEVMRAVEEKPSPVEPITTTPTIATKVEPGKPPSRAGACRVCLKAFKPDDFSRTCAECTQRVCEDCASYSKLNDDEDPANWTCSVCRRYVQFILFIYSNVNIRS